MACNCIKDFGYNIAYDTCKKIVYQDATIWVTAPSSYDITITTPIGTSATLTVPVTGVLVITSQMLGLAEDINIPSGIYCVTVENCNGDVIQKDFLNICTYECQLANLIAAVDFSCNDCDKTTDQLKEYESIRFMLEGAKAKFTCDWCSVKELKKLLEYVNKKLQQNNCSC